MPTNIANIPIHMSLESAHTLVLGCHIGLVLCGILFFFASFIYTFEGGMPDHAIIVYPWLAAALVSNSNSHELYYRRIDSNSQGIVGASVNSFLFAFLYKVNQPDATEFPRTLYHRRQIVLICSLSFLSVLCAGDVGLFLKIATLGRFYFSTTIICLIALVAA